MKLEKAELTVSESKGGLTVQRSQHCPDRAKQVCSCHSKEQHLSGVENPGDQERWSWDKSF